MHAGYDARESAPPEACWYAVWTRSRQEKVIARTLAALGFNHFLPLVEEERQWSDRRKRVSLPLFPGYLFVRLRGTPDERLHLMRLSGVVELVGGRQGPVAVPEMEIASIRAVLARGVSWSPCTYPGSGDRVRVVRGVLAGIEGRVIRQGAQATLVLSVEAIRRSISVNVAVSDVETVFPAVAGRAAVPGTGGSNVQRVSVRVERER